MLTKKSSVNYIQHLSGFFAKCENDSRLGPRHVTLYLSLFRQWNAARFKKRITIKRAKTMKMGMIDSRSTYTIMMKRLVERGYIRYYPSTNAFEYSEIEMIPFDKAEGSTPEPQVPQDDTPPDRNSDPTPGRNSARPEPKNGTLPDQNSGTSGSITGPGPVQQSVSNNKPVNGQTVETREKGTRTPENVFFNKKKKSGRRMRRRPARREDAETFFLENGSNAVEAARFFRYYEGIGWIVGGRSPITDWEAVALNWIDGEGRFPRAAKPGERGLGTSTDKPYDEPY